jgi:tRNA modification GTPase
MSDTIYALATAPGKAGVSVVRISGPHVPELQAQLGLSNLVPRRASLRHLTDESGGTLDHALVISFPSGQSFTGEPVLELQTHGSLAVQKALYARLERTGLCRLAEPGEFTRRAFLNERLDLTQVNGLADLIEAETEEQRKVAQRVFEGAYGERVRQWRDSLVRASALLAATIDFADEEVPEDVTPAVRDILSTLQRSIDTELSRSRSARSLREGFVVAIVGPPNVGKSSLLNALAGFDAALVSDIAGTTRDLIEVPLDIYGLKVRFVDTAGIRLTDDQIEVLGVERAMRLADDADLRLFLHEGETPDHCGIASKPGDLVRRTKVDLNGGAGLSSKAGTGLPELLSDIHRELSDRSGQAGFVTRERDIKALSRASGTLGHMLARLEAMPVELICDELTHVQFAMSRIIGDVGVEDVLDVVFSTFCLGK